MVPSLLSQGGRNRRGLLSIHPASYVVSVRAVGTSPSNLLSLGLLPSRRCFVPAPRALTLTGQTPMGLAHQPYRRRLLCSSGLSFRIITVPCGLSLQCTYRVGRTKEAPVTQRRQGHRGFSERERQIIRDRTSPPAAFATLVSYRQHLQL